MWRRSQTHLPSCARRAQVPYECEEVSLVQTEQSEVRRIPAAGVLPYAVHPRDGRPRFLIGRERQHAGWVESGRWADFGGRREKQDTSVAETAAREAWEETMGMVHPREVFLRRMTEPEQDDNVRAFDIKTGRVPTYYRLVLMQVPYQDYNTWFQRARSFITDHHVQFAHAEKDELAWVSADTLLASAIACIRGRDSTHQHRLRVNFARAVCALHAVRPLHEFK